MPSLAELIQRVSAEAAGAPPPITEREAARNFEAARAWGAARGLTPIEQLPGYAKMASGQFTVADAREFQKVLQAAGYPSAGSHEGTFMGTLGELGAGAGTLGLLAGGAAGLANLAGLTAAAPSASAGGTSLASMGGGTGIVPGAGGATGLTAGTTGATGLSTVAPAGTAFAPGFFSAETAAAAAPAVASGLRLADLARAAPGLLGAFASEQQGDDIRGIEERARADRAPFLDASKRYLADPGAYIAGPGQAALDATLRRLSVSGNPATSPTSLGIATEAGMRDWRDAVLGFGNLGLAGEDTRANLALNATKADANVFNSLGGAAADVLNPPKSLADLVKEIEGARRSTGSTRSTYSLV